ncbi:hypothetical protein [Blautia sp.]|nr:hypothetical protein [Blautia sp.]
MKNLYTFTVSQLGAGAMPYADWKLFVFCAAIKGEPGKSSASV